MNSLLQIKLSHLAREYFLLIALQILKNISSSNCLDQHYWMLHFCCLTVWDQHQELGVFSGSLWQSIQNLISSNIHGHYVKISFTVLLQKYISVYFQRLNLLMLTLPKTSQVKRHAAIALWRGFHPQSWHKLNTDTGYLWEYSYSFLTTCGFALSVTRFSPKANT